MTWASRAFCVRGLPPASTALFFSLCFGRTKQMVPAGIRLRKFGLKPVVSSHFVRKPRDSVVAKKLSAIATCWPSRQKYLSGTFPCIAAHVASSTIRLTAVSPGWFPVPGGIGMSDIPIRRLNCSTGNIEPQLSWNTVIGRTDLCSWWSATKRFHATTFRRFDVRHSHHVRVLYKSVMISHVLYPAYWFSIRSPCCL